MALYKGLMVFQMRGRGWTEGYWWESSQDNLETQYNKFLVLAGLRAPLMGKEAGIKALRVSVEGPRHEGFLRYQLTPGLQTASAAPPDDTLLAVMRDQSNRRMKHVFMRGIYDDLAVGGGEFDPTAHDFKGKFQSYTAAVIGGEYGWYGQALTIPQNAPFTGYTQNANKTVAVALSRDIFPLAKVGERVTVRISGVNNGSVLNGTQVVVVDSTDAFTTAKPLSVVPWVVGGVASYSPKEFIRCTSMDAQKIGTRKAGAPLLESPGRRPARAKG